MKSTKADVQYQASPKGNARCAGCTMFLPPSGCSDVEGSISPQGWCRKHYAIASGLAAASRQTDTMPTEAQKEAGNYRKGKVTVAGLDITIENPKGSRRSGVSKDGTPWSVVMPAHYGYITRVRTPDESER